MHPSRRHVGLLLASATALAGAVYASPAPASAQVNHRLVHSRVQAAKRSLNWAGYVKTGTGIKSIAATWHVPTLKTNVNGYSSTWVGIDGATSADQYLIQTGTEADVVNGKAQYHAWWEVITPTNVAPETLFAMTVRPGDTIRATVSKASTGKWTMSLHDYTTNKTVSHTASFAGPGKSAEWIQEDTDVNGYISVAPNWQKVAFTTARVNGVAPALVSTQAMDIYDSRGTRETSTGAPNATKDGFTVTWLAAGTRTYAG